MFPLYLCCIIKDSRFSAARQLFAHTCERFFRTFERPNDRTVRSVPVSSPDGFRFVIGTLFEIVRFEAMRKILARMATLDRVRERVFRRLIR